MAAGRTSSNVSSAKNLPYHRSASTQSNTEPTIYPASSASKVLAGYPTGRNLGSLFRAAGQAE